MSEIRDTEVDSPELSREGRAEGRREDNVSIITVKLQARRKRSGHGHAALLSYQTLRRRVHYVQVSRATQPTTMCQKRRVSQTPPFKK